MGKKINVAEILKNCPTGMELDCTMYDNLYFDCIREHAIYPIVCYTIDNKGEKEEITFNWYGKYALIDTAKCVIFPKGKTTWEGFVPPCKFKDGDVLHIATGEGEYSLRMVDCIIGDILYTKASCSCNGHFLCTCKEQVNIEELVVMRFATEEEKEKLFKAIKDNGYKWNAETKALEKLVEPKFKVGDRITNGKASITIGYIDDEYYYEVGRNIATRLFIKNQDEWNLVPNKFDIRTLKPFESKVLVRDDGYSLWQPCVWGLYDKGHRFPYVTTGCRYRQCIPYKGNEYLLGKTEGCKDFYKTWE